jgi:hypothetical protein
MELHSRHSLGRKAEPWIALTLCFAVLLSRAVEHLISKPPSSGPSLAPQWLPIAASAFAAAGIIRLHGSPRWLRVRRALLWSGLLLMVWVANGLPFDLFRIAGLMPFGVDWPGLATRTLALAAVIVLAHLALARPADPASTRAATLRAANWYGYAAFVFAMPYPVLRTHWAFGGTFGLAWPGAGGKGFAPLLFAIPFVLAAAQSLLLASPRRWMPRRLLLAAGWTATAIMAMIGPAACWVIITMLAGGHVSVPPGMAVWVPCLFYGSWLLFAIAEGAATRSYQLRSQLRSAVFPTTLSTNAAGTRTNISL